MKTARQTRRNPKVRPTRLHGFTTEADQRIAYLKDGDRIWTCLRTRGGWIRTDEYTTN
jgi:hypothetical protein